MRVSVTMLTMLFLASLAMPLFAQADAGVDVAEVKKRYEAALDALRKKGEHLTIEELAPPPIPDDRNAALLYERAFKLYDDLPEDVQTRLRSISHSKPLTAEQIDELRELLSYTRDIRKTLLEASALSCRFPLDYDQATFATPLPHISPLQHCCALVAFSARLHLEEGRPDDALADCGVLLRMSRSVDNEPILISVLVGLGGRYSLFVRASEVLDRAEPAPEALRSLLTLLGPETDRARLLLAMRGECCMTIDIGRQVLAKPETIDALLDNPEIPRGILTTDSLSNDLLFGLECSTRLIPLASKPWFQSAPGWDAFDKDLVKDPQGNVITRFFCTDWSRSVMMFDRGIAQEDLLRLAIALRLHRLKNGAYPDSLEPLAPAFLKKLPLDPFSGKNYIYRREGKGFILYSIGDDMTDDGGTQTSPCVPDIVLKCSR